MVTKSFPYETFCNSLVRFLDALDYQDDNLTSEERVESLRYVHSKTLEWFTQPMVQKVLKEANFTKLPDVTRTITTFTICCWPHTPKDVQVDINIYWCIINVLDDETDSDPSDKMSNFWDDLLKGVPQTHPYWILMNAHMPRFLSHYGSFCAFNIMRGTIEYFEACWIEQHNFQGFPGSDAFPLFMRRLGAVGGAVGGTLFPASEFDDKKLMKEFACVMAQIDNPAGFVNDLFSFYKEYDQDEANLVTNWCTVDGITLDEALVRLTDNAIDSCVRILKIFKEKDQKIYALLHAFLQGYGTWHLTDLRYRMHELHNRTDTGPSGDKFNKYFESGMDAGWVDLEKWHMSPNELFGWVNK